MNAHPRLTAEATTFHGWQAVRLGNGLVQLVAVPDIGGRVMAYDVGPHPFLFVDPDLAGKLFTPEENQGDGSLAAWKNYGGDKTWPAPQGWDNDAQWHGPPDPVLDTGRYTLAECGVQGDRATLTMVSPPDARTGVQITRRFTLRPGTSRVALELSFRNIADRPIRWSIWDVVQLRADMELAGRRRHDPTCTVTVPLNPHSRFEHGYQVMFGAANNSQWQAEAGLFHADYKWEIGKVGLDSAAGWIAFSQGSQRMAFVERFPHFVGAEYPDGGCTVECWTVGAGQVANLDYSSSGIYLMETEVLSPLYDIAPGQSVAFALEWAGCRCFGEVLDVQPGGCAGDEFYAARWDDMVHLTGSFGVFDVGELQVVWLSDADALLAEQTLGPADPLSAIVLDRMLPAPAAAARVELCNRTQRGESLLLAAATVTGR